MLSNRGMPLRTSPYVADQYRLLFFHAHVGMPDEQRIQKRASNFEAGCCRVPDLCLQPYGEHHESRNFHC